MTELEITFNALLENYRYPIVLTSLKYDEDKHKVETSWELDGTNEEFSELYGPIVEWIDTKYKSIDMRLLDQGERVKSILNRLGVELDDLNRLLMLVGYEKGYDIKTIVHESITTQI